KTKSISKLFPARLTKIIASLLPKPVKENKPTIVPAPAQATATVTIPLAASSKDSINFLKFIRVSFLIQLMIIINEIDIKPDKPGDHRLITKKYIKIKRGINKYQLFFITSKILGRSCLGTPLIPLFPACASIAMKRVI